MPESCLFKKLINTDVRVKIIDIGSSRLEVDTPPPYASLMEAGDADVIGFEPRTEALAVLDTIKGPHETYLPCVVGDGLSHTFYLCDVPTMSSLFKPNPDVLRLFHGFSKWGQVVASGELITVRLDDIPQTAGADMIKLDIQGAELMALQNATDRLKDALVVHTEAEFLPLYIDQPLFSDVEQFLRTQGFVFHRFYPLVSRAIMPVSCGNAYEGISQLLWADAVFVRDLRRLDLFSDQQLLKAAMLVQECYSSIDLAHHFLMELDRRHATHLAERYLSGVVSDANDRVMAGVA